MADSSESNETSSVADKASIILKEDRLLQCK